MEISIIVPVYNVEKYLKECLDSILRQTFRDYEIICINDCSTDNSLQVLKEYEKEHMEIKVINNPINKGLSYSRNIGLEIAKGKYIAFVDSDDYLIVNALEILHKEAEEKELEILYFDKEIIYEDAWKNQRIYTTSDKNDYLGIYTGKELFVRLSEKVESINPNAYTQFFLRDFLIKNTIKFYERIVHEDYLFYFVCAMNARRVAIMNRKLYVYRKREGSITSTIDEKRKQSVFIVFIEILNYWKNNKFTEKEHIAIKKYIELIYRLYTQFSDLCSDNNSLMFGTPADSFLYEIVSKKKIMNSNNIRLTNDELELLEKKANIWIYGAGAVGLETFHFLQNHSINIEGFVVSDKRINPKKILGMKVYQLDEIQIGKEDLFIIAVKSEYQKIDIKETLDEKGIKNIIFAFK